MDLLCKDYEVEVVADGEAAWESARACLRGPVLPDLHMPRKAGFEVREWIRQEAAFQQLPVIAFSSSATPSDVHEACRRGVNSFLIKPLHFEDWVELLRTARSPKHCACRSGGKPSGDFQHCDLNQPLLLRSVITRTVAGEL